jgi:hypothetical protein
VEKAVQELGTDIPIEIISDESKFYEFGISKTPALIVEKREIKSIGTIPSVEVIKEWVKNI